MEEDGVEEGSEDHTHHCDGACNDWMSAAVII